MAENTSSSHIVYAIKYHFMWITKYRYKVLRKNVAFRLRELSWQRCAVRNIKTLKGSIGVYHGNFQEENSFTTGLLFFTLTDGLPGF